MTATRSRSWLLSLGLLAISALSGCAGIGTQFRPVAEPTDGARARLRVIGGGAFIKAVPGKSCIDWSSPGAGTVIGGIVGSNGYRGRSLGMPDAPAKMDEAAELTVAAGEPFTLALVTGSESSLSCFIAGSFVPEAGKDYEARMQLDVRNKMCTMRLAEIGANYHPLPVQRAKSCD